MADVKFNIKINIDGKEHIVGVSTDVKKLANEMGIARGAGDKLRETLIGWNHAVLNVFYFQPLKTQELEGLSTFKYKLYKSGELVDANTLNRLRKYGLSDQDYEYNVQTGFGGTYVKNAEAFNAASRRMGNQQALDDIEAVRERYEQMRKVAWEAAKENGSFKCFLFSTA